MKRGPLPSRSTTEQCCTCSMPCSSCACAVTTGRAKPEALVSSARYRADRARVRRIARSRRRPRRHADSLGTERDKGQRARDRRSMSSTARASAARKRSIDFLKEHTDVPCLVCAMTLRQSSISGGSRTELLVACDNDRLCWNEPSRFHALIRNDVVGLSADLRAEVSWSPEAGTSPDGYATTRPNRLPQQIVSEALEPLVYVGPAEGNAREEWRPALQRSSSTSRSAIWPWARRRSWYRCVGG